MAWHNFQQIPSRAYTCGFCGNRVASDKGYHHEADRRICIYICPHCDMPTFFAPDIQVPGVAAGNEVRALPKDIHALYREARACVAAGAHTAAVLTCRKLLMNIAVSEGAAAGKTFMDYVEYLAKNGYVPPKGKDWVDHIRRKGNEANHEIVLMTESHASELISFAEMLLKFIYEFPSRVPLASS